jgi:hypothetical protein
MLSALCASDFAQRCGVPCADEQILQACAAQFRLRPISNEDRPRTLWSNKSTDIGVNVFILFKVVFCLLRSTQGLQRCQQHRI